MTTLNTSTIQALIPNRYPLFYIDHVSALVPDESLVAEKYVSVAEDHLVGYLPDELTMPPTLIIETLAQAASILILKSPKFAGKTAYLGSISKADFSAQVPTGSVLTLAIKMVKVRENMGVVATTASIGDELVCHAELHSVVEANA